MNRKRLLKLQIRSLYLQFLDRLRDLANLVFPIFVVSGIVVACFRFWLWVFGW